MQLLLLLLMELRRLRKGTTAAAHRSTAHIVVAPKVQEGHLPVVNPLLLLNTQWANSALSMSALDRRHKLTWWARAEIGLIRACWSRQQRASLLLETTSPGAWLNSLKRLKSLLSLNLL